MVVAAAVHYCNIGTVIVAVGSLELGVTRVQYSTVAEMGITDLGQNFQGAGNMSLFPGVFFSTLCTSLDIRRIRCRIVRETTDWSSGELITAVSQYVHPSKTKHSKESICPGSLYGVSPVEDRYA